MSKMASLPAHHSQEEPVAIRLPLPPRKPMATARRVSLFEREIRIRPSTAAIEILFELAVLLSEGQAERGGYFGSTMITIDVERAAGRISDACDAATVRRLAEVLADDERVKDRARAVGLAEAERHAGGHLHDPAIDVRVRATGHHLHIDVDIEAKKLTTGAP
jgi:hypothetical protein